jgi:methionyl-tRNA formyltransferase
MGSSFASAECLRAILREPSLEVTGVITQPDRPAGRGKALTACPCAQFAARRGIEQVIKPENVNSEESLATIRSWKPDVIAVVAFGQILKKPLLELPPFGCVNCHFSLLPKYRGAAPVIASLLSGDRKTGVTVMHMSEGLDDGPIMLQSYEPIYPDTTGGELMNDLATAGAVALAKALKLMSTNELPKEIPQDEKYATYVKKLKKSDGLIDWNSPTLEIERKIRAYFPWPGCFTFLPERLRRKGNSGRLGIERAKFAKLDAKHRNAPSGTVVELTAQGPVVKCLDGALLLTEVKPEGGKAMDAGAFLRGRQLITGEDRFVCA